MSEPCDQLSAFLDGELPEAEAAAFRLHLADCPDCPARLDSALQLAGLSPAPAPGQVRPKPPEPRVPLRPRWARRAGATAVLALVSALVVILAPLPANVWCPD